MKKLLVLLGILISTFSYGQRLGQPLGSANSIIYGRGGIMADQGFINSRLDTLNHPLKDSNGAQTFWEGAIWLRVKPKWIKVGESSGGTSDGNNFPSSLSFNNGVLTLGRTGLSNLTANLDGRYLTSYVEQDPIFLASVAATITSGIKESYDRASVGDFSQVFSVNAPVIYVNTFVEANKYYGTEYIFKSPDDLHYQGNLRALEPSSNKSWFLPNLSGQSGTLTSTIRLNSLDYTTDDEGVIDLGTLSTDYVETDPVFLASVASSITNTDKSNWNNAVTQASTSFGWGNHASVGYLTNITGKIIQGTGTTITGSGTTASPYVINATGGGLSSGGFKFTNTQPTDTTVNWVDTRQAVRKAWPIRVYVNGAWSDSTDASPYWDFIGNVISYGKPINIAFSGQSNVAVALYRPADDPGYTGDTSRNPYITYFDFNTGVGGTWKVWQKYNEAYPFDAAQGAGTNNIVAFARELVKKERRSIRLVGTREPGIPMKAWEKDTSALYVKLVNYAHTANVGQFDAFVWVHGEAGLGTGSTFPNYRAAYYDFINRLRLSNVLTRTSKIISTSHGLAHGASVLDTYFDGEGVARSLDIDTLPYTGWAGFNFNRVQQNTTPQDIYHFTTREHEWMGTAIFNTYNRLPFTQAQGDPMITIPTYNTTNTLTKVTRGVMAVDTLIQNFHVATGNTGYFGQHYAFGTGNNNASTKVVIRPTGSFQKSIFGIWSAGDAANDATIADRALEVSSANGITGYVPFYANKNIHINTGQNNAGNATIYYHADGNTNYTGVSGKSYWSAIANGTGGVHDLEYGYNTSGVAVPGTHGFIRFTAAGRVGIGTMTPNSTLDLRGSFATSITNITASRELAGNEHFLTITAATAPITVTLAQNNGNPGFVQGREYWLQAANITNPITIVAKSAAGDAIRLQDGTLVGALTFNRQYQVMHFKATGQNTWTLINPNLITSNASGNAIIPNVSLGVGTTQPNPSAIGEFSSTNRGALMPRMTIAQRDLIVRGIASFTVTNQGSGYTTTPTVTLTGNGTATASVSGGILQFLTLVLPGTYTTAPIVTITGGGGTGATATAILMDLPIGLTIFCTDATATDGSTGVMQTWNGTTWKNNW